MSSDGDKADPTAATELVIAPGCLIDDRYVLDELLGAGGMGEVWRAHHHLTHVRVALKLFTHAAQRLPGFKKRFMTECAAPGRIAASEGTHSPALACFVRHHDAGWDRKRGIAFIAMDLLVGEDLEAVHERQRLSPEEVVDYIGQVAVGLDAAHAVSYVHRDIKPANLFLCKDSGGPSTIKIIDWGIAKLEDPTASGTVPLATWPYCSPEQALGLGSIDGRADVFSLAMTAFSLLAGRRYYEIEIAEGAGTGRAVAGPKEAATVRAARYEVQLPQAFDGWFEKGTAVDPADRFEFASELAAALAKVFGLAWTVRALPSPPRRSHVSISPERRARRRWVALLVASGVALVAVATLVLLRGARMRDEPRPPIVEGAHLPVVAVRRVDAPQAAPEPKAGPASATALPQPQTRGETAAPPHAPARKPRAAPRSNASPDDDDPLRRRWPER